MTGRPEPNEYAEYYADYVKRADVDDIIGALEVQIEETTNLIRRISEAVSKEHRDGKWSVREVVGHLNDSERVFSYRAFRFSRNDSTPLASFEQDNYVHEGRANERTLNDLLEEFAILRRGTVATFRHITPEIGTRRGTASGKEMTVRAMLYVTLGHVRRHLELIRERYGG
jgi:hypothetical protein